MREGVANQAELAWMRTDASAGSAEVAIAIADDMHQRGVGTLLLEHLISLASGCGFRASTAEMMSGNALVPQVFADAGLQVHRSLADGVYYSHRRASALFLAQETPSRAPWPGY